LPNRYEPRGLTAPISGDARAFPERGTCKGPVSRDSPKIKSFSFQPHQPCLISHSPWHPTFASSVCSLPGTWSTDASSGQGRDIQEVRAPAAFQCVSFNQKWGLLLPPRQPCRLDVWKLRNRGRLCPTQRCQEVLFVVWKVLLIAKRLSKRGPLVELPKLRSCKSLVRVEGHSRSSRLSGSFASSQLDWRGPVESLFCPAVSALCRPCVSWKLRKLGGKSGQVAPPLVILQEALQFNVAESCFALLVVDLVCHSYTLRLRKLGGRWGRGDLP
jgi:hypothetical protein